MAMHSTLQLFVLSLACIVCAACSTSLMKRFGAVDEPNHRSSHVRPVPRSGGVAIVVTTYFGVAMLVWLFEVAPTSLYKMAAIGVGAFILALAGLFDDLGRLNSFKSKLLLQALGCCALFPFGLVIHDLPIPFWGSVSLGWWGYPVTLIWVLGLTNIFNFMDGLDGLAAGTATIVAALLVVLMVGGVLSPPGMIFYVLLPATLGFLFFNFPRAQIFLGDVGSQFLGFVFAATAVLASQGNPAELPILIMPLMFFHFIFDTIFTFCRRLRAGENVTQAHKSHLYQLLNQSGQSHARVSMLHFAFTLAQGAGAFVMLHLPANHQWNVFLPFLMFEIIYAIIVMKTARSCGALDRSRAKSL